LENIRSSFSAGGVRLFCEAIGGQFVVYSRWQQFHRTEDIHEALAVFEGLCFEKYPSKAHARHLVREARRNNRLRSTSNAAWEWRVIRCAWRRSSGLVPKICGSKASVEVWGPLHAQGHTADSIDI